MSAATQHKAKKIAEILGEEVPLTIIFVDTRAEAWALAGALRDTLSIDPDAVLAVTAEVPQKEREKIAADMRAGRVCIVVATSTWSTGIDIPALRYVFLTGRRKAPIGALQEVGRSMRVSEGKPSYEIINLVEPGAEKAAERREEILLEEGFEKSEATFLDELDPQPQEHDEQQQGSHWLIGEGGMLGPVWVWKVAFVFICIRIVAYLLTGI
jgi:superfamily II DNA/RNA helicase